ncbi:MAG: hypothetical protein A2087_10310 [Spirochaetes bacterium GWD1_61_31]|nr:MAG: hypothetical protein A2087_10310 [Spirochaetes bacterium GWD1_61_31]
MIFWGPSGFYAYRQAREFRQTMLDNQEILSQLQAVYLHRLQALRDRPDELAAEARGLGYVIDNEVVLRLETATGQPSKPLLAGSCLVYQPGETVSDKRAKRLGFLVGLGCFLATGILWLASSFMASRFREPKQAKLA